MVLDSSPLTRCGSRWRLCPSTCHHLPTPPFKCRCVSFMQQRWGAGRQSEPASHQFLASLPPPTVVFPQDLLEKGLEADNFAMLGLGDIVIPGEQAGVGSRYKWWRGLRESRGRVCDAASPLGTGKGEARRFWTPSPGSAQGQAAVTCQALSRAAGEQQ